MAFPWVVALVALTGCDAIFGLRGIEEPSDAAADVSADAPAFRVSGRYYYRIVTNNAQRQPTLDDTPIAPMWTAVLDDGSRPAVTTNPDGTFFFDRAYAGQPYRLIRPSGTASIEYQFTADRLDLMEPYWGRLARDAPAAGTALTYSVPNAMGVLGNAYAHTTGLWSSSFRGTTQTNSMFTIDWPTSGSMYGLRGLLRIDKFDRAYYVLDQYVNPYYATVGYRSDDITLTSGSELVVSGNYQAVSRDQCIRVVASRATETARLTAADFGAAGSFYANWSVLATPHLEVGPNVAFLTAHQSEIGGTNADLNVQVGNVYPGHSLMLGMGAYRLRDMMAPGATTPLSVSQGSQHWVLPTTACTSPSTVTGLVGLPRDMAVDGTPIAADGTQVMINRAGLVTLSWQLSSGTSDRNRADLYEVIANGSETTMTFLGRAISVGPSLVFDPSLFKTGATYTFYIETKLGYPNIATGDLATIGYPHAQTYRYTTTFVIAN